MRLPFNNKLSWNRTLAYAILKCKITPHAPSTTKFGEKIAITACTSKKECFRYLDKQLWEALASVMYKHLNQVVT